MAKVKARMLEVDACIRAVVPAGSFWKQDAAESGSEEVVATDATFVDDVCAFALRRQARALDKVIPLIIAAFVEEFEKLGL